MVEDPKEDVSGESMVNGRSLTHAAKVTGPERPRLIDFFKAELLNMLSHAKLSAHNTVAHGGEPNAEGRRGPQAGMNRDMLEAATEVEKRRSRTTVNVWSRPKQSETYACKMRLRTWYATKQITTKRRCRS